MRVLGAILILVGGAYLIDQQAANSKYTNTAVKLLSEIRRGFLG